MDKYILFVSKTFLCTFKTLFHFHALFTIQIFNATLKCNLEIILSDIKYKFKDL